MSDPDFELYVGDAASELELLATSSVDAVVTSPPYLDVRPEYDSPTREEFAEIFHELARVCRGGMLWNAGRLWRDGVERPWWIELIDVADEAGWDLWDTVVWLKPNANPIKGRRLFTDAHEYVFAFGREGVEFNVDAVRTEYAPESIARYGRRFQANSGVKGVDRPPHRREHVDGHEAGARPRSYITAYTGREKGNPHPAPMALDVAMWLVEVACRPGQIVLDPFAGSGTTAAAARLRGRRSIAIEKNPEYADWAARRLGQQVLDPRFA